MAQSASMSATTPPRGGNNATNTTSSADPYLTNDFYPLSLASSEVLLALRADEAAPDADLYRRLIISSGDTTTTSGGVPSAHRYHLASANDGLGEVGSIGGGAAAGTTPRRQSSPHDVTSPLAAVRATSPSKTTTTPSTTTASTTTATMPPTSYLKYERSLPLPAHLANEMNKARLSCLMGVSSEANLVWLTSDDKLFLWSYDSSSSSHDSSSKKWGTSTNTTTTTTNDGHNNYQDTRQDYCRFTVPSGQCIVSVAIVRPKSNVFTNRVQWCVVITTPDQVLLCALATESLDYEPSSSSNNNNSSSSSSGGFRHGSNTILHLIPTRYCVSTDSIPITSIGSMTNNGRIFLGGVDGNLYEMTYEGYNTCSSSYTSTSTVNSHGRGGNAIMEAAIDDYFDGRGEKIFSLTTDDDTSKKRNNNNNNGSIILSGGKRIFSALTFGSLDDNDDYYTTTTSNTSSVLSTRRSRKCRKINHTSVAPSIMTSIVPSMLLNVATNVFGSSIDIAARDGGSIVSIIVDEERLCLYTLSAKGVICVYDISPPPSTAATMSADDVSMSTPPPRLASVFDSIASAKLYLDAVSRGRMYPPLTNNNVTLGTITFPGGTASAQAGVGGMEGARDILKRHEIEERMSKAKMSGGGGGSRSGDGHSSAGGGMNNNGTITTAGILQPVSIHLVPMSESKSLTLVVITGGGLRYYLSSLRDINSAQAMRGSSVMNNNMFDSMVARTRPGKKMIFCHIRAPPPYTSTNNGNDGFRFELAPSAMNLYSSSVAGDGGLLPGTVRSTGNACGDVVKGSYSNGVFVLALDIEKKNSLQNAKSTGNNFFSSTSSTASSNDLLGDVIVAAMPDFAVRFPKMNSTSSQSTLTNTTQTTPSGISETILLPLSGHKNTPILPGGRTFDIVTNSGIGKSRVVSLFVNSETPTEGELQVGLMPTFIPPKKLSKKPALSMTSSALTVWSEPGRGIISTSLSAISNYLRSRQGVGHQVGTVSQGVNGFGPSITYRISLRHGCTSAGFSASAKEVSASSRAMMQKSSALGRASPMIASTKSARLPSWMLHPSAAPLNSQATQHILPPSSGAGSRSSSGPGVLIVNSGGLHFFSTSSPINNLATILIRATNVAKDAMVKNVFVSYGYVEGCAMCFALATSSSSDSVLRTKAEQAALCNANQPMMKLTGPSAGDGMDPITSYTFQPSYLYQGLVMIMSRLLRPFWYKPAVVVTEGGPIQNKSAYANYYTFLPAKVELLLDDLTLDELRRPLLLLQNFMKKTFVSMVQTIPGSTNKNRDAMEVDEVGGLITRAIQYQSRASAMMNNPHQTQYASAKELRTHAFSIEDRNMHSLYRLLSRCVQILDLISCLRRAHSTPALPEVQWGLLHGLTYYQLASTHEGQLRIESLLNALVSQGEKSIVSGLSTDGDLLAETLANQCYLFFSSASRLTYLGFRSAKDALSRPITSQQRIVLSNQAASYLRAASRHWYSPALVAGRYTSKTSDQGFEIVATNAKDSGSPLALAAEVLMELNNVEGLADVCLICASNFGGSNVSRDERKEFGEDAMQGMLPWEQGLYHRPPLDSLSNGSMNSRPTGDQATLMTGIDVTATDALHTCHSIIFYYISKLLSESNHRLAEDLVASCAASSDKIFLHSLYDHLLATDAQTAIRIDSTSLEDWLLNVKKDVNLLWSYYSFHGHYTLAGDIMYKKATDKDDKTSLDQRIECLTRAANSYSTSINVNHSSFGGRGSSQTLQEQKIVIERIQELLDVAAIQKRVLTTITQSQDADLEQAKMDALIYTLVNISDLYNEYSCPLNLFDVCLLILETCRYNEPDNINTLWKSIICEEVLPCQTNSPSVVDSLTRLKQGSLLRDEVIFYGNDTANELQTYDTGEWIPRLRNRVTALGKELYGKGADYTFPIDLIVRELEGTPTVHIFLCL